MTFNRPPQARPDELNEATGAHSRVLWVDYARGIGITLVVYGHVLGGLPPRVPVNPTFAFLTIDFVYSFHMPLFFFLSGLFAPRWLSRSPGAAIAEKLRSLAYPYFVWSLFQGILNIALVHETNIALGWIDLASIPIYPIRQFWFLYILFLAFLAYRALRCSINEDVILIVALSAYLLRHMIAWWLLGSLAGYFVFFALGVSLAIQGWHPSRLVPHTMAILAVFAGINVIALGWGVDARLIDLLRALSGIATTVLAAEWLTMAAAVPMLRILGASSMAIYVAHVMCGAATRIALLHGGVTSPAIHLAIGIIVGLAFPVLVYRVATRAGIRPLLFGR